MIQIENLSKKYNEVEVLKIVQLEIPKGQSFGLVGNNGAGKTTLFSLMLDLIEPTKGHITNNQVVVNKSQDWKFFTNSFIDESFLISYLTAEEYFYFIGKLKGMGEQEINDFLISFSDFFNDEILGKKKYLRDFSKGNQKKIGIVASFMGSPELIILDEPFTNLDPSTQIKLKELIQKLKAKKSTTILISSHDLMHTTEVCDRIVVLDKGTIVKDIQTTPETLKELQTFFVTTNH